MPKVGLLYLTLLGSAHFTKSVYQFLEIFAKIHLVKESLLFMGLKNCPLRETQYGLRVTAITSF